MIWNVELKLRIILLVLGNCAAHPHFESLNNIQLEFLSVNTTFPVKPTDTGIIKDFKTLHPAQSVNQFRNIY
jgi:hypothetical protein